MVGIKLVGITYVLEQKRTFCPPTYCPLLVGIKLVGIKLVGIKLVGIKYGNR